MRVLMQKRINFNRKWVTEFYQKINPEKAAAIKVVCKNTNAKADAKPEQLSYVSARLSQ